MTTPVEEGVRPAQVVLCPGDAASIDRRLSAREWWGAVGLVLAIALVATVPTAGDMGLTWDEPAYRFSQLRSAQWWDRFGNVRSWSDVAYLLDPDVLLFYWPYGRHGINFHPPLAGQLSLLTHAAFGHWMQDIPSRRMASVIEFALTITIGFGFLSWRYGFSVGAIMAGSLLLMPRVYGDAHVAGTDMPGLLLWAATALAFWKGLYEPNARLWRVLVGVLMGLGFVEKMGTILVLAPLLLWLILARLSRTFSRSGGRLDWIDGLLTSAAMLVPLVLALAEIRRLTHLFPSPSHTDLFVNRPMSSLPGAILAIPMAVWFVRRLLGRVFRSSPLWGPERPALEIWTAVLAFAPVVGWLGNPAWWRETLPRLAHYYMLNTDRRGSLPDIRIFYLGQTYLFSLPWHNAWVLIAVTVPTAVLAVSAVGILDAVWNARRDRLPLYFVVQFLTLPVVRMLPTPAHDGVRLLLPAFFFLSALAGLGAIRLADGLSRLARSRSPAVARAFVAALVLGPSAWQLAKTHPFELSYYNELIGGPRGAWRSGLFELSYWYDAFNPRVLADLNQKLPTGAEFHCLNDLTKNLPTFSELQTLGHLRPDIVLGWAHEDRFPYVWVLSHDSKATSFTRLLYAMTPWYAQRPRQLDGLRVVTVADPVAVSRAWALWLLAESEIGRPRLRASAIDWFYGLLLRFDRFLSAGVTQPRLNGVDETFFSWAHSDPDSVLAAARRLAARGEPGDDPSTRRLMSILNRHHSDPFVRTLLRARPEALVEAVKIVIARPEAVRTVLTRESYTDTDAIGGALDLDLIAARPN